MELAIEKSGLKMDTQRASILAWKERMSEEVIGWRGGQRRETNQEEELSLVRVRTWGKRAKLEPSLTKKNTDEERGRRLGRG